MVKGDVIIVEAHHRRAAGRIVDHILPAIEAKAGRHAISVAGESGSGKSETATAIAEALDAKGVRAVVLQQDDYFVYPPRTNDATRRRDIGWVGTGEVRLDLLDGHVAAALAGAGSVIKPLVVYEDDAISQEELSLAGAKVVIAEGTYTTLLEHVDTRVFIARNRLETMEARRRRAREAPDPFLEEVLTIEHGIIAPHRERADIIITRDYDVEFRDD